MARGDHLYYFMAGGTYSHHGLDCGDGTVIHYQLTPWMKLTGKFSTEEAARVARTPFEDFALGNEVFIRDYKGARVDDVETVMERANSRVGEDNYSVFGNNCEHFAVWCKTGEAGSSQVDAHISATKNVLKGAPIGAFLLRAARRVPGPYRKFATAGAIGMAGAVYVISYIRNRMNHVHAGLS